jgi:UDP-N-acetylmuramoyl-tripeptide--D-alanyl-D-alanine ligase
LLALQDLANYLRNKSDALIVGIAGSNGKTTSKEFCAALLSAFRKVHYSKGSFNNHWGVPFTLLAQPEDAEVSVVEMGMNHEGELARLAEIAEPDIAVCTYVGVEHIEYFLTLEKIAAAEEEIYKYSPSNSTRIYNLDNEFTKKMYDKASTGMICSKFITFSEAANVGDIKVDVQMKIESSTMHSLTVAGQIRGVRGQATVSVFGRHNLTNLMTAAAVALAVGISPEEIWQALPRCKTNWGRNQLVATESGAEILFDGYNSNPDSMKALVENMSLIHVEGKKIGIFAEMRELGELSSKLHFETGEVVGRSNLDQVWFYGDHHQDFVKGLQSAKFRGVIQSSVDYQEATATEIAAKLKAGDIALVKGSRGMQLERFVKKCKPLDFGEKG